MTGRQEFIREDNGNNGLPARGGLRAVSVIAESGGAGFGDGEILKADKPDDSKLTGTNRPSANKASPAKSSRAKSSRSKASRSESAPAKSKSKKTNITVRLAKASDLEPARVIARALHEKTIFGHIPWSDEKFDRQFGEVLKLPPNKVGLVAERAGRVLGFAYLTCGEYFAGTGHVITTVQSLAIDSDNLGPKATVRSFISLVKGAKKWAETRGSEMVLINVTTGVKLRGTDQLLRRAGAKCIGGGYVI
jgi:hypothetical protein